MILEYKEAKYVDKQYTNGDSFAVPDDMTRSLFESTAAIRLS